MDTLDILAELNPDYDYDSSDNSLQLCNSISLSNFNYMESLFINDMESTFMTAFREINLGEQVMNGYIDFCVKRHDLDTAFFSGANLQFRWVKKCWITLIFNLYQFLGKSFSTSLPIMISLISRTRNCII